LIRKTTALIRIKTIRASVSSAQLKNAQPVLLRKVKNNNSSAITGSGGAVSFTRFSITFS
jgi:hypothetical protein